VVVGIQAENVGVLFGHRRSFEEIWIWDLIWINVGTRRNPNPYPRFARIGASFRLRNE
jgi:hypothetical protein